ncbi:hypothetical protein AB3R30_19845 [Leptolyngbyaceae cyanobacterium UHCC 1019]
MRWIEFPPLAEFEDCRGDVRPIRGCSLVGRFEFGDRLSEIWQRLATAEPGEHWQQLYVRDRRLQFLIKRCLELNGIQPEWVNLFQVEDLLIARETEQGMEAGWLVTLNAPKTVPTEPPNDKPAPTLEEILAALSLSVESVPDALELADRVPGNTLMEIVTARSNLQKPPEQKRKEKMREWGKGLRQKAMEEVMREGG